MAFTRRRYCRPDLATGADDGSSWADAFRGTSALSRAFTDTVAGDVLFCEQTATIFDDAAGDLIAFAVSAGATTPIAFVGCASDPGASGFGDGEVFETSTRISITGANVIIKSFRVDRNGEASGTALELKGDGDLGLYLGVRKVSGSNYGLISWDSDIIAAYIPDETAGNTRQGISHLRNLVAASWIRDAKVGIIGSVSSSRVAAYLENVYIGGETGLEISNADASDGCLVYGSTIVDSSNQGILLRDLPDLVDEGSLYVAGNVFHDVANAIESEDLSPTTTVKLHENAFATTTNDYVGLGGDQTERDFDLSGDPFVNYASLDLELNDTAGAGALIKETGAFGWSFGAVQTPGSTAGGSDVDLSGEIAADVTLASVLEDSSLELAGEIAADVTLSAALDVLSFLALAGEIASTVALVGTLDFEEVDLAATLDATVALSGPLEIVSPEETIVLSEQTPRTVLTLAGGGLETIVFSE